MKTSRWLPAALALSLTPGLALAQDRTADPTRSTGTDASRGANAMPGAADKADLSRAEMKEKSGDAAPAKDADDDQGKAKGSKYTLWKLHQANQMEIEMSQLALTNSTSKEVKGFAQRMISDHKGADAKVTQLAKKTDADLDQKPSAADKAEMDEAMSKMEQLKSTKGGDFDAQFVKQMADDHKKVVDLVTTASQDSSQKDIQPLLTQLLPKLQQHEKMAMRLQGARGGMKSQGRREPAIRRGDDAGKSSIGAADPSKEMGSGKDVDPKTADPKDIDSSRPR